MKGFRLYKIKWAIYTAAFVLVAVLQFTPHLFPAVGGIGPLLLIPAAVCVAMFEGETAGAVFGIVAGILWDSQGTMVFGFDALFLLVFCLFISLLVKYIFRNTLLSALLFSLVSTVLLEFLSWFFFRSLFGDTDIVYAMRQIILPTVLYTVPFTVPFYYAARAFSARMKRDAEGE